MRILITNIEMSSLTGTTTVVRDLALGLRARGHDTAVFTHLIGPSGQDLLRQGIPVVDDIDKVPARPDVIHGHHSVPAALTMAKFPGCPCVWWRHGVGDWFDPPPRFTRIRRLLAVDLVRQHKLAFEFGVPPGSVEILPNGVDLDRIGPRPEPLPSVPTKMLAFPKWSSAAYVPDIQKVCARLGLGFLAIGFSVGRATLSPEQWLIQSDIVFASGRAALEGMCCGSAVIVGDDRGMAGMVTSENFHKLRSVNFGSMAMTRPLSLASVEQEIRRYDMRDANAVSRMAREAADMRKVVARLEAAYTAAIAEQTGTEWTADDTAAVDAFVAAWPANAQQKSPWADWNAVRASLIGMRDRYERSGDLG